MNADNRAETAPTAMQTISAARESYLKALQSLVREVRSEHQEVFTEIGFEPDNEEVAKPFRLMRIDAAFVRDGKASFVLANLEPPAPFEPIRELWKGLEVEVHPLVWNEIVFEISGSSPNEAAIAAWRERWMDDQDKRVDKAKDLQGVVHSVTQPTRTSTGWSTTVDFGSADVDAFCALIDLFRQNGAARVIIGSALNASPKAT
jgi:hypothetical protein